MNIEILPKELSDFKFNIIHMSPEETPEQVVFIFPGAGYGYMGPLLYYPTQWMIEKNMAIIIADYDFRFFEETSAFSRVDALKFCLKECLQFSQTLYPKIASSFLGKSIGTQALCFLKEVADNIKFNIDTSKYVWLTPVWKREECLEYMINFKSKSLYIIGDADSHYSKSSHVKFDNNKEAKIVVIPNADHSLDNDSSTEETFKIHREVFNQICNFLK
jgi:hypothetical protein